MLMINLGLALANSLSAIGGKAQYIDSSVAGIGKGLGNLKTIFFVAYLHAVNFKRYKLNELLEITNYVRDHIEGKHRTISIKQLIMGISDLSIDEIDKLPLPDKTVDTNLVI